MNKFVQVALKVAHNNGVFTYKLTNHDETNLLGRRVKVYLRKRLVLGVIVEERSDIDKDLEEKIKDIVEIVDDKPVLTTRQFELLKFCANYYFNPLGLCIHLAIPRNEKMARKKITPEKNRESIVLTKEQEEAAQAIMAHERGAFLLEGITGSGKTLVYIKIAETMLAQGKSVLFIVPEISLTPELIARVEKALGVLCLVLHSNVTSGKKRDAIFSLLLDQPRVVIGARSAIFSPLPNLGLIVVDEEHDASLKQDESPRYHARDLALWRAKNESARIILGSATPSLESIFNAQKGKLHHLTLRNRYLADRPLPDVTVIDLKQRALDVDFRTKDQCVSKGHKICILSRPLVLAIEQTLSENAQVLLFLNQRGYAKFGVCYRCGQMVSCPNCSIGLTYYQRRQSLSCHFCQYSEHAQTICRHCKNDAVNFLGLGTERLEEEVKALFPTRTILRLDRDVVRSDKRLKETLTAMHERTADILIGTQMIAKGHNFLHVGLVGIVCADIALSTPDFRAAEKTFQLLTQVAGRAGRGHFKGQAIIQTYNPTHPSIVYAKDHDVTAFIEQEMSLRRRFAKPPFARTALIRAEHADADLALATLERVKSLANGDRALTILGPTTSPIEKINLRFRMQCMILAQEVGELHRALNRINKDNVINDFIQKKRGRFIIDVDPQNLS